ncbi:MAG: lysine--tRNA ligase [Candidatus Nanoarchaeia archaeon]
MEEENVLIKERKRKLEQIREMGINPFAYKYDVSHSTKSVKNSFDNLKAEEKTDKEVSVAGRIVSFREMGKASFAHIQDEESSIQVYFRKDDIGEEQFKLLNLLDIGDFLGVNGTVFKTKRGELTIYVQKFKLLTKSLRPLPEKYHGIKDEELKHRKRYLDCIMNPDSKDIFKKRAKIYRAIRKFLDERGYIEVQTPILQTQYGGANARPFVTNINAWDMPMYLRIAYELHLKRMIVAGFQKVYDLSSCFRNEGVDKTHNPEFAMMEIQTAYMDYNFTMELAEELWEFVAREVNGSTKIKFGENEIDLKAPWKRMTMFEALKEHANIDVEKMSDGELKGLCEKHGIECGEKRGEMIPALFEELVEDKLIQPVHITDHPVETCPLAKEHREDNRLIERCESFINGWEVGNYYSELANSEIQREHFEEQVRKGRGGDEEAHPLDEDYIEALEYGLPPNAGIGIGIERMVMLLTGQDSIRDVIFFPIMKPQSL